jgi:hypothetical protein
LNDEPDDSGRKRETCEGDSDVGGRHVDSTIKATLWCYRDYINRWRRRFSAQGVDGLGSQHQGQKPTVLTPALKARILAKAQQRPPDGSTH